MFCPHCGTALPADAQFCSSCGQATMSSSTSAAPVLVPIEQDGTTGSGTAESKQYDVWFVSAVNGDQFGFVRHGIVTTQPNTVSLSGNGQLLSGVVLIVVFGIIVRLAGRLLDKLTGNTAVSIFIFIFVFAILVFMHYFFTSRKNFTIQGSSITNVQRSGRKITFSALHPNSGKTRKAKFKASFDEEASELVRRLRAYATQ